MEKIDANGPVNAVLMQRCWVAPGILEIRLSRPPGFTFIPGQFARLVLDDVVRDYTMVSDPDDDSLAFCIAVVEEGRFTTTLREAAVGSTLPLTGPHGHFVYQAGANPAVFVATGTGVAPFVAFARRGGGRRALLLHGVGSPDRLIYRDLLQSWVREYVPCISQPGTEDTLPANAFVGRVTHYLERHLAAGQYDFYLCGRRTMIRDATTIIDRQFGASRLFIETYD